MRATVFIEPIESLHKGGSGFHHSLPFSYTINCVSMFRERKTISASISFDIFYTLIAVLCLSVWWFIRYHFEGFYSIVRIVYKSIRPET